MNDRDGPVDDSAAADDLAARVLSALEPDRTHSRAARVLRIVLTALAGLLALMSIQTILGLDDTTLPIHAAHHDGAYGLALAVGFFYTALRPRRAGALLPVVAVLAVLLTTTTVIDVIRHDVDLVGESRHLVQLSALFVMWALVRIERPHPQSRPQLHAVPASTERDRAQPAPAATEPRTPRGSARGA
jgi:hypothetical protein